MRGAGTRPPGSLTAQTRPLRLESFVLTYRNCYVVAPNEHMLGDVRDTRLIREERLRGIPNGVDVGTNLKGGARDGAIWYGRDDPLKGIPAFLELVRAMPDEEFVVLGDVTLPAISNLSALGWVQNPQSVIAASRVAITTSVSEGSPNFLLQAAGIGLRIVGFENAAMFELKRQMPERVLLVPHGDLSALADALRRSLAAPSLGPADVVTVGSAARMWSSLLTEATEGTQELSK